MYYINNNLVEGDIASCQRKETLLTEASQFIEILFLNYDFVGGDIAICQSKKTFLTETSQGDIVHEIYYKAREI